MYLVSSLVMTSDGYKQTRTFYGPPASTVPKNEYHENDFCNRPLPNKCQPSFKQLVETSGGLWFKTCHTWPNDKLGLLGEFRMSHPTFKVGFFLQNKLKSTSDSCILVVQGSVFQGQQNEWFFVKTVEIEVQQLSFSIPRAHKESDEMTMWESSNMLKKCFPEMKGAQGYFIWYHHWYRGWDQESVNKYVFDKHICCSKSAWNSTEWLPDDSQ
jgi:hypothetical protein